MAELNMSMPDGTAGEGSAPVTIPRATAKAPAAAPKVLPLWDPEKQMLRAVPTNEAPEFAQMGWKVGSEAQIAALNHSGLAKTAAATLAFSNATNLGATDVLLSTNAKGKSLLREEQRTRENNPGYSLAGSVAGTVALGAAGGYGPGTAAFEDLSAIGAVRAIEAKGAAKLGAKALQYGARGADIALQGAPAMAIQGAMDEVVQQNMLDNPITAQQLAASAFHSVVDGAAINLFAHGVLKTPGVLRKSTGASMDYLEKWGALKREMEEVPHEYGPEGKPGPTKTEKVSKTPIHPEPEELEDYVKSGEPSPIPAAANIASETAATTAEGEASLASKLAGRLAEHPEPNMSSVTPEQLSPGNVEAMGGDMPMPPDEPVVVPGHYPTFEPPVPKVRKPMREPGEIGSAREQLEKAEYARDKKQSLADTARELSDSGEAVDLPGETQTHPETQKILDTHPDDLNFDFKWQKKIPKKTQIEILVAMTEERLADAHPDAPAMWKEVSKLSNEIGAIKATKDFPNGPAIIEAKKAQKAILKENLRTLVPREIDKELGVVKPGYHDYDQEYRRIHNGGKLPSDYARPVFSEKAADELDHATHRRVIKEADNALKEAKAHRDLIDVADKADGALKDADFKVQMAEKKLSRLEASFETAKKDADDYAIANHERDTAVAKRRYDAKINSEKAVTAARAESAKAVEAKAAATAKATEARQAARKAEKIADDAQKKAKKAADQAAKDLKKTKAAREAAQKRLADAQSTAGTSSRTYTTAEGVATETTHRKVKGDYIHEKVTVKVTPHEPSKVYKKGNYRMPWSGSDFANVGKAGFYTGMAGTAGYVAGGMAAHNFAIKLAQNRKAIGEAFEKFAGGLSRGISAAYKAEKRGQRREHHGVLSKEALNPKHYPEVTRAVNYLSQNPETIVGYVQQAHPNLSKTNPKLLNDIAIAIQRGVQQINTVIPKKPFSPTLQNAPFEPTRAQKVGVLRLWQAMGTPEMALAFGDHTVFSALDKTYPDLQDSGRQQLLHHIQNENKPIRGRKARQFSQFIGAPVRPNDEAATLKRMQQTAGPEPMKKPTGGGKPGASSKITNQAAQRDMPVGSLSQLGG